MAPRRTSWVLAVLATLAASAAAAFEVPRLERRVTDLAELMSAAAVARLEADLERLERETGAQVAVLTVPSLGGVPIEDASIRVAEAWRLGREAEDDGVLLLVARDERRIRIEVGYGLEPVLTDAESGRIIDNVLRPAFRAGDFSGGIERAVTVIGAEIRGTGTAPVRPEDDGMTAPQGALAILVFVLVVGVFSVAGVFTRGCMGWFMYVFLLPFWWGLTGGFLGARAAAVVAVGWLVLYPIARTWLWRSGAGKRFRRSHPGWVVVSGGSRGGGFSSGGFGGFSGGGGSFGGGGASGGW